MQTESITKTWPLTGDSYENESLKAYYYIYPNLGEKSTVDQLHSPQNY